MFRVIFCSFLFMNFIGSVLCIEWWYDDNLPNGPIHWGQFDSTCDGRSQSPINFDTLTIPTVFGASRVQIKDIDKRPSSVNFENDGHGVSVSFNFADNIQPRITGGPLGTGSYIFHGLHLHWKSEHTVNRHHYDAEMHIVHYNSKYRNLNEALNYKDGVAVLGVLFYVPQTRFNHFDDARPLMNGTFYVREPESAYLETENLFSLYDVIDTRYFNVWSYEGSLTTPNCNEAVTWMVHTTPLRISHSELHCLQQIKDERGIPISRNNRPIQPLNGRTVLCF